MLPNNLGGTVQYQHHITEGMAAVASGWLNTRGLGESTNYGMAAGLRWDW